MNTDVLQGKWKQVRGEVKRLWGKLTDDDLQEVEGNYEKLVGKVQARYGYNREKIQQEIDNLCRAAETRD